MNKTLLGAHLSYTIKNQLKGVIEDSIKIGGNSGAFYISNSRGYNKYEQNFDLIKEAKKIAISNNIELSNFIVHSPLVGNIANCDLEKNIFEKTIESYYYDLKAIKNAGIKYYNFHPGSWPDKTIGINQISKGINLLHEKTKNDETVILLETMMSKGNYIGSKFEELNQIILKVNDKSRIGVCLDTCHVWDAGYDIKNNLDNVLKEFDNKIGLNYLKALHINDSKNDLNSNKDRHENIGKGFIGLESLKKIVNHPLLINLPKSLETPYGLDDFKKWKDEIKLLVN